MSNVKILLDMELDGMINTSIYDQTDSSNYTIIEALNIIIEYGQFVEKSSYRLMVQALEKLESDLEPLDYEYISGLFNLAYPSENYADVEKLPELVTGARLLLEYKYSDKGNMDADSYMDPPLENNEVKLTNNWWARFTNIEGQGKVLQERIDRSIYYKGGQYNKEVQDYNKKILRQY